MLLFCLPSPWVLKPSWKLLSIRISFHHFGKISSCFPPFSSTTFESVILNQQYKCVSQLHRDHIFWNILTPVARLTL